MNIQEMLSIIKTENLYEYAAFQVGPPNGMENVGVWAPLVDSEGIFQDTAGEWKMYREDERGAIQYATVHLANEEDACNHLLLALRTHKAYSIEYKEKKIPYIIKNKNAWWA